MNMIEISTDPNISCCNILHYGKMLLRLYFVSFSFCELSCHVLHVGLHVELTRVVLSREGCQLDLADVLQSHSVERQPRANTTIYNHKIKMFDYLFNKNMCVGKHSVTNLIISKEQTTPDIQQLKKNKKMNGIPLLYHYSTELVSCYLS